MNNPNITIVASGAADQELDAYVSQHPLASACHYSAWRNSVEKAYQHPAWTAVARNPDNGQVIGILPFSAIKRPWGKTQWVSAPFADWAGSLSNTPAVAEQLLLFTRQQLGLQNVSLLELRHTQQGEVSPEMLVGQKVRMLVKLPASSEILLASYKPKLRSQIKKAEKNGLTAVISHKLADIEDFYQVYSCNMRRLGSPPHSIKWFRTVFEHYLSLSVSGQDIEGKSWPSAFLVLIKLQEKVVGAGLVLRCGTSAVIPWASTLSEYNHLAPNMLLYWNIQAHLADSGVSMFDFGRSTFAEGTFRFKQQWGAEPVLLQWSEYLPNQAHASLPAIANPGMVGKLRPLVERCWRLLPLSVCNTLGPALRRYITL